MKPDDTEKNLLFGLLALQLGFFDRATFRSFARRWAAERSQPLGEILVKSDVLGTDQQRTVNAVVETLIDQYGGDAKKSLESLHFVSGMREEIAALESGSTDVTQSFMATRSEGQTADSASRLADGDLAARESEGDDRAVGELTSSGRRFRFLHRHATGGLGQVSVVIDTELGREVALKELKDDHANRPESRARFIQEAEITGGLEHPGIVPVYGLGQYEDGRPFYAMRLIKGDSLKDAIDAYHQPDATTSQIRVERTLALRRLLARFLDVCHAVHYAHRRGILHRDLKPSNIMLGEFGETLVVDWGLAKAIGRDNETAAGLPGGETMLPLSSGSGSGATQFGSVLGTPAYMSPEQAAGATDDLGPETDVYSLGATLYCLLSGRPPFVFEASSGMTPAELLTCVREGSFPPPRDIQPKIARPLEAICLKAMSRRPADRYPSVQDLADDIERHLADELVSAYAETRTERLARWTRRNRIWVRAATVSLVVVTAVAIASAFLINSQRKKAERAAAAQTKARNAEAIARMEADTKRKEAEQAHQMEAAARAEEARERKKVEKVVEYMVDALRSPDPQRSGQSITVAEVLEQAMKKTETHLADEPLIRAELLSAIGRSFQGLGLPERAAVALEPARDILRDVLGENDPQTRSAMNNLASAYLATGRVGSMWSVANEVFSQAPSEFAEVRQMSIRSAYDFGYDLGIALVRNKFEKSLEQARSFHGPHAPPTRQLARRLVKVSVLGGDFDRATQLGREFGIEAWVDRLLASRLNRAGLPPEPDAP